MCHCNCRLLYQSIKGENWRGSKIIERKISRWHSSVDSQGETWVRQQTHPLASHPSHPSHRNVLNVEQVPRDAELRDEGWARGRVPSKKVAEDFSSPFVAKSDPLSLSDYSNSLAHCWDVLKVSTVFLSGFWPSPQRLAWKWGTRSVKCLCNPAMHRIATLVTQT